MERRALVIGINYTGGAQSELAGCINDATFMADELRSAGYAVVVLRDDVPDAMPTGWRILTELGELVGWARQGGDREIAIHFSGHGVGITDTSGDEADGKDECMVACDNTIVRDDVLHDLLEQLPAGCKATLVIDCCHSGTMADLPYQLGRPAPACERTVVADVLMLSGCMDAQTSADAIDLRPEYQCHSGAMTSALLLSKRYATTWVDLVKLMRFVLKRKGFRQIPQLTASFPITETLSITTWN